MLLSTAVYAQEDDSSYYKAKHGHYLTLEAGFGLQTISHDINTPGKLTDGYGQSLKAGYRWYFCNHFGLGAAAHYQQFASKTSTEDFTETIDGAQDELSRTVHHLTVFHDFSEKNTAQILSIPIGLYYHGRISKRWKFNAGAGLMYNIAMSNSLKTSGWLETRFYYDQWHLNLGDVEGHHIYTDSDFKSSYKFKQSTSVFAEIGVILSLNRRIDITINALGSYGLTPVVKSTGDWVYDPDCMSADAYTNPKYNGILTSDYSNNSHLHSLTGMIGIRYRIGVYGLDFDEYSQSRHLHDTEGFDFKRDRKQEFDKKKRKHGDDVDSTELAEEERRRREVNDLNFNKEETDTVPTIDSVVVVALDTIKKEPVKEEPVKEDTVKENRNVLTPEIESMVAKLIEEINKNYCDFNDENMANAKKQRSNIEKLASYMRQYPEIEIYAIGHTCDIGSLEQNKEVGMRRAKAFADELIKRGVSPNQIECVTKWYSEPLVPNTSEANRAKNRRVELKRNKK